MRFCRNILGVKNLQVVQWYIALVFRKLRIIQYWIKLDLLLRNIYNMLANDAINNVTYNGNNWAYNVKSMLDSLGLSYIWDNQDTFEKIPFSVISVKQRTLDHYENTPIQIYRHFHLQKLKIFRYKNSDIFHMSAQNIDCGYSLEPPWWGGSNEYPQSMFLIRNKKIIYTPVNLSFQFPFSGWRCPPAYLIWSIHISTYKIRQSFFKS